MSRLDVGRLDNVLRCVSWHVLDCDLFAQTRLDCDLSAQTRLDCDLFAQTRLDMGVCRLDSNFVV